MGRLPDLDVVTGGLFAIHSALAGIAKSPELIVSHDDCRTLGSHILAVAAYYPGVGFDPKWIAWGNLTACAAGLYIPRVTRILARKRLPAEPEPENVIVATETRPPTQMTQAFFAGSQAHVKGA